eukprot:1161445-Pelagomonas_calceolata.AAC.13
MYQPKGSAVKASQSSHPWWIFVIVLQVMLSHTMTQGSLPTCSSEGHDALFSKTWIAGTKVAKDAPTNKAAAAHAENEVRWASSSFCAAANAILEEALGIINSGGWSAQHRMSSSWPRKKRCERQHEGSLRADLEGITNLLVRGFVVHNGNPRSVVHNLPGAQVEDVRRSALKAGNRDKKGKSCCDFAFWMPLSLPASSFCLNEQRSSSLLVANN